MAKNILIVIVIIIILAVAGFLYFTRPASAPSEPVNSAVGQMPINNATTTTKTYRISQDGSQAEFHIGEVLNGKQNIAVGTTNQVAGDITISANSNLNSIALSKIAVNARTFKTDSSRRDGAIARFILRSEDSANEFIYFTPKIITGAPAQISVGDTLSLNVSGDLTISGITKTATFGVTLQVGESDITGTTTTKIKRSDFNLTIPSVPSVASVEDEFIVSATITAPLIPNTK